MEIKKVVLKLNIHDDKDKQKAMKAVSSLAGINSVNVDMKESKMTVIGEVDPISVTRKLRKQWNAQIVTVGPPKEENKDDKKDDKDDKKEDKKDDKNDEKAQIIKLLEPHRAYNPPIYYHYQTIEENPNTCVIC